MHALSNNGLRQFTDPALNVDEWRDNYTRTLATSVPSLNYKSVVPTKRYRAG